MSDSQFDALEKTKCPHDINDADMAWTDGLCAYCLKDELAIAIKRAEVVEKEFNIPPTTAKEPYCLTRAELESRWHTQRVSLYKLVSELDSTRTSWALRGEALKKIAAAMKGIEWGKP